MQRSLSIDDLYEEYSRPTVSFASAPDTIELNRQSQRCFHLFQMVRPNRAVCRIQLKRFVFFLNIPTSGVPVKRYSAWWRITGPLFETEAQQALWNLNYSEKCSQSFYSFIRNTEDLLRFTKVTANTLLKPRWLSKLCRLACDTAYSVHYNCCSLQGLCYKTMNQQMLRYGLRYGQKGVCHRHQ